MPGTGAAGASYGDLLVMSLLVLGGVCVAAFVVVRLFGRFVATGRSHGAHLLDVVARLPLEPRRSLYVVEVAGKTLLVGTSEMGLSVLSELDGDEVRSRAVARPSFGDLVKTAWLRRRSVAPVDGARAGAERDVPAERAGAERAGAERAGAERAGAARDVAERAGAARDVAERAGAARAVAERAVAERDEGAGQ